MNCWILGMIWLLLLLASGLSANNSDNNISNNSGYVRKDTLKGKFPYIKHIQIQTNDNCIGYSDRGRFSGS